MDWILEEAKEHYDEIVAHRRWLHSHAEVGFELTQTKAYVRQVLEEYRIEPQDCGRAGLTALFGKPENGKTILLRADMDALPIPEESGLEHACRTGAMHACGHDMHTAMLLGAAKILKRHENELPVAVKLMFQPAEETFEGSKDMIRSGILENPRPDAAVMIHVAAATPMPAGMVIVCQPGVSAPAADYFTMTVQGVGCHGSAPHLGIDPLIPAANILLALQELHARELPASEEAVLTIGTIHGGTAPNVIADSAQLCGTIRTYSEETRAFLKSRIQQISKGIAEVYRANAIVEFGSGCPTLVNDKELAQWLCNSLRQALPPAMVLNAADLPVPMRGGGSEDFSYISHEIPSVMLALAAGEQNKGYTYSQHHPKVRFDEDALPFGTAALVASAFGYTK